MRPETHEMHGLFLHGINLGSNKRGSKFAQCFFPVATLTQGLELYQQYVYVKEVMEAAA